MDECLNPPRVVAHLLPDDGEVPNNPVCALLAYRGAVRLPRRDPAALFEDLFERNGWPDGWRNGVYPFHHFHSNAHEVLGVFAGEATVLLGGPEGVSLTVAAGDVLVVPAGVGHKKLASSGAFGVVGAYPRGQRPDMCRPDAGNAERVRAAVRAVPLPEGDPVYGPDGPLLSHWARSAAG